MKIPYSYPMYFVWIYASDGSLYSIIPFKKKKKAYKRMELLHKMSHMCSVERELPCDWTDIGVIIHV